MRSSLLFTIPTLSLRKWNTDMRRCFESALQSKLFGNANSFFELDPEFQMSCLGEKSLDDQLWNCAVSVVCHLQLYVHFSYPLFLNPITTFPNL